MRLSTVLKAVVAAGLLVALPAGSAWAGSPSGSDIQARVERLAQARGVSVVQPSAMPDDLINGLVATEDERFWEHHGLDLIGAGRAVSYDAVHLCACQGGSTITQQLVKTVYLDGSDAGWNKVRGMALAFKVERVISKRQILADYFTVVLFGYDQYGADAAACTYYGRHLAGLDLAQSALLAGMPQAPAAYDPRYHPGAARDRRAQVLEAMLDHGYITSLQARAAAGEPILASPTPTGCS